MWPVTVWFYLAILRAIQTGDVAAFTVIAITYMTMLAWLDWD